MSQMFESSLNFGDAINVLMLIICFPKGWRCIHDSVGYQQSTGWWMVGIDAKLQSSSGFNNRDPSGVRLLV
jgi:hypothetical protein